MNLKFKSFTKDEDDSNDTKYTICYDMKHNVQLNLQPVRRGHHTVQEL